VDGEPARVYRADHLLRAVAIPAGRHTVEMRYESTALRTGIAVSLLTVLIFVVGALSLRYHTTRN
jgi:uncharacterized membrane protein YfhO